MMRSLKRNIVVELLASANLADAPIAVKSTADLCIRRAVCHTTGGQSEFETLDSPGRVLPQILPHA
jgi:hypothetical protein